MAYRRPASARLSKEIIKRIAGNLGNTDEDEDNSDLASYRLISSTWDKVIRPIIFRRLRVTLHDRRNETLPSLYCFLSMHTRVARYVEHLSIADAATLIRDGPPNPPDGHRVRDRHGCYSHLEILVEILSILPRLRSLYLRYILPATGIDPEFLADFVLPAQLDKVTIRLPGADDENHAQVVLDILTAFHDIEQLDLLCDERLVEYVGQPDIDDRDSMPTLSIHQLRIDHADPFLLEMLVDHGDSILQSLKSLQIDYAEVEYNVIPLRSLLDVVGESLRDFRCGVPLEPALHLTPLEFSTCSSSSRT